MKIEIEISQASMEDALRRAASKLIGKPDSWSPNKLTGDMAEDLQDEMQRQIMAHFETMDLRKEIASVISERSLPTIRDAIERELKTAARKAVKEEMGKPV